jgi:hypothetical protein
MLRTRQGLPQRVHESVLLPVEVVGREPHEAGDV